MAIYSASPDDMVYWNPSDTYSLGGGGGGGGGYTVSHVSQKNGDIISPASLAIRRKLSSCY